jgi:hypothetical protein
MSHNCLIATGHGYAGCTAFDGFKIIAAPLPGYSNAEREARVFRRASGNGCDYGSHTIALAVRENHSPYEGGDSLYLLVSHGAGREVWAVPSFYDGGEYERALVAMPERLQYAALYTLYRMASEARREGVDTTRAEYVSAFVQGRLKKSRPKQGRVRVTIEPHAPSA